MPRPRRARNGGCACAPAAATHLRGRGGGAAYAAGASRESVQAGELKLSIKTSIENFRKLLKLESFPNSGWKLSSARPRCVLLSRSVMPRVKDPVWVRARAVGAVLPRCTTSHGVFPPTPLLRQPCLRY